MLKRVFFFKLHVQTCLQQNPENLVCRAVRAIKAAHPGIGIICDVALDPYTSHGQDGLVIDGVVVNDASVEVCLRVAYPYGCLYM